MKFHYAGKFNGDENSLPQKEHVEGSVKFKEPDDMNKLAIFINIASVVLALLLEGFAYLRSGQIAFEEVGFLAALLSLVPHEFLHAILFKEDVYMYTNLKQGMMFVTGTEDMSKSRYILMSLCPNIVFGFIPFLIFMINPKLIGLGTYGLFAIAMGVGDYLNVFNALTQMPKGAKTYLCGMHSYWYMPRENGDGNR